MKMKNTALRALYGALTLSLIILGGCDQPTSSNNNNNNDPEEDLWHTLLMPDGTARMWRGFNPENKHSSGGLYTFFPDRSVGIRPNQDNIYLDGVYNSTYSNGTFDGTTAIFDNGTNMLIITFLPAPNETRQEIRIVNKRYENFPDREYMNTTPYCSVL
jgi:hypothetical protein